jgi:hypothetical protein
VAGRRSNVADRSGGVPPTAEGRTRADDERSSPDQSPLTGYGAEVSRGERIKRQLSDNGMLSR